MTTLNIDVERRGWASALYADGKLVEGVTELRLVVRADDASYLTYEQYGQVEGRVIGPTSVRGIFLAEGSPEYELFARRLRRRG